MINKIKKTCVFFSFVFCLILTGCGQTTSSNNSDNTVSANNRIGIDYLWYGISQYNMESDLPTLATYQADLNANIIRFDIYWYFVEPTQGNYDWSKTDAIINNIPENTEILFTIYCTAPWAIKERRDNSNQLITSILPSNAPVNYDDYATFINNLVSRYKSRIHYYQIENEVYGAASFWFGTSNEYLTLLQTAYTEIKTADPTAKVLPSSIAFGTIDVTQPIAPAYQAAFNFINLVYSSGKNYFDIADIHLYYTLESIPDRINWLKTLMADNNITKPIWVSETGGIDSRATTNYTNTSAQSIDLAKRYIMAFANDAQKIFWLTVHQTKDTESLPWKDMKLTHDSAAQEKKPAYYTLKLLTSKIDCFSTVASINNGYMFTVNDSPVLSLWNTTTINIDASSYFDTNTVQITHIITNTANITPQTELVSANSITIDSIPIFVEKI